MTEMGVGEFSTREEREEESIQLHGRGGIGLVVQLGDRS